MPAAARLILAFLSAGLVASTGAEARPASPWVVDFSTPAQAIGNSSMEGMSSALFLFPPGSSGSFDWSWDGGELWHHEALKYRQGSGVAPVFNLPSSQESSDGQAGTTTFSGPSWGSLYIVAEGIRIEVSESSVDLLTATPGNMLVHDLWGMGQPIGSWRLAAQRPLTDGPEFRSGQTRDLLIVVDGLVSAEWHNATVACDRSGACPSPPSRAPPPSLDPFGRTYMLQYDQIIGSGALSGSASGVFWIAHGTTARATTEGVVRLPLASAVGPCADCLEPDGKTLRLEGEVSMQDLQSIGDKRMKTTLQGEFAGAHLDEQAVEPALLGLAVGGIAAAAVGTAVLIRLLLLARWSRPKPHPRRQELAGLVAQEPGITFLAIGRRTGLASGVLHHHLGVLERDGAIVSRRKGKHTHFFENHGRYNQSWRQVSVLRSQPLQELHSWIASQPHVTRKDILAHAVQGLGWPKSTTLYRLRQLLAHDLLAVSRAGRQALYTVRNPAVPAMPSGFTGTMKAALA